MANVFENGEGDARQGGDIRPSLFRPRYRKLSDEEVALHDKIKAKADELAALFEQVDVSPRPDNASADGILVTLSQNRGGHIVLGLRHLEDAVYRAVKALTS